MAAIQTTGRYLDSLVLQFEIRASNSIFSSAIMSTTPTIQVIKNGFGAEITGLDFADGVTDEAYHSIEDAVKKHGFAVIRKTNLVDETHLELARKFGDLDDVTPYNKAGRLHRLKYNELFDVGNVAIDGSIVNLNSPRGEADKGNALFHTDSSFNPRCAGYSLLLAHELPPPGTGGSTAFADMRAAYRDLDEGFKALLHEKNYIARHSILHSKKLAAPECFKDIDPTDYFMGRHLLLQVHERSDTPTIYLAKHIHSLEGVAPEESQAILDRLFDHATQDKYIIEMEWKDVGDLVVWDNTCTMHRAIGGEFMTKYRRDMRRATVHDDSSQAWGFNPKSDEHMGLP
ncbi:2,4-dichlorophenoxyacetate alpha-ketoglutarate dioxygenase [Aspergillus sclerotioniger CBS 115572]|uniref:2,4-dichlorophenoxyacetate alpha-ketoglutarate dioxygenase n=1 Tax=Aspergillus sclerotioniger CBS 115572 TaxID=1450535 RepID=A0A317XCY9_9EURO|nr:2,4-dichlorophenoxyacetate alpha-ketoglutarate dioxygenase [Aspergillus sclerotioniger CBS 115572]PWY94410.1 2,4-dichlorophenoxyacetate alpha-ketoglutarate dioxygenase [Aspergillus sclerotioniger CBS 115572]